MFTSVSNGLLTHSLLDPDSNTTHSTCFERRG